MWTVGQHRGSARSNTRSIVWPHSQSLGNREKNIMARKQYVDGTATSRQREEQHEEQHEEHSVAAHLGKGIAAVNQLDTSKFEQFLRRIVTKLKVQDAEVFTEDEQLKLQKIFNITEEQLLLAIKTLLYVFKRLLKFVFMPKKLKNDLVSSGFSSDKGEVILKTWSIETKAMVNELDVETQKHLEDLNFSWKVNAELSSDYHKKSKVPKAYLSLCDAMNETEIEFTHPELYSMFLQFESIQNELDNVL